MDLITRSPEFNRVGALPHVCRGCLRTLSAIADSSTKHGFVRPRVLEAFAGRARARKPPTPGPKPSTIDRVLPSQTHRVRAKRLAGGRASLLCHRRRCGRRYQRPSHPYSRARVRRRSMRSDADEPAGRSAPSLRASTTADDVAAGAAAAQSPVDNASGGRGYPIDRGHRRFLRGSAGQRGAFRSTSEPRGSPPLGGCPAPEEGGNLELAIVLSEHACARESSREGVSPVQTRGLSPLGRIAEPAGVEVY